MTIHMLPSISMHDVQTVGGKAGSLGELLQAGLNVPPGFVVTPDDGLDEAQILAQFDQLGLTRVAVRSSGISEDSQDQSWAGQFATFLHVDRAGLLDAIKACRNSAKSERVQAYGPADKLAVLVQQMIHSESSGVAFSINPITGNKNQIMIEAVWGLCEPLVQGTATPDNYTLSKSDGEVLALDIASKPTMLVCQDDQTAEVPVDPTKQDQPALTPKQLVELVDLVRRVEAHYAYPVDIEWAYQGDQLYLLQARPITTA